jgi:hypothetical protein
MTNEITAFSADEARRLVAQWRAKADDLYQERWLLAGFDHGPYLTGLREDETALRQSADELEAILPEKLDN